MPSSTASPFPLGNYFVKYILTIHTQKSKVTFGVFHILCLLRNLYAGQEATVRIGHGTTDWNNRNNWNNREQQVPNRESSTSRLYIVTLLI